MSFEKFKLKQEIMSAIEGMGYKTPTGIQDKCIPLLLAGKDVIGQSLTGSGKTAAFGLPIINNIIIGKKVQALVLVPTRELAQQVGDNLQKMAQYLDIGVSSIYGGVGFDWQTKSIPRSEIIVATPGRLLDHVSRGTIYLRSVKFLVLDEADRMLDMGFDRDIEKIINMLPKDRQTVMFSATMPQMAQKLAHKYLRSPEMVQEKLHVDTSLLKQIFYVVPREKKFSLLVHLLKDKKGKAIVFCRTKREVDKIARNLRKQQLEVMGVHGDIPQNKRQFAVNKFKDGTLDALIATDVASRGLDIKNISHVYNFDVPRDADDYTHRIGRTARAGASGEAITLVSEGEWKEFNQILRKSKLDQAQLPEFEHIVLMKDEHGRRDFNDREGRNYGGRAFGGRNFGERGRGGFGGRDSSRGFGRRESYPRRDSSRGFERREQRDTQSEGYGEKQNYPQREKPNYSQNNEQKDFYTIEEKYGKKSYPKRDSFRRERSSFGEKRSFGRTSRNSEGNNYSRGSSFGGRSFGRKQYGERNYSNFSRNPYGLQRHPDDVPVHRYSNDTSSQTQNDYPESHAHKATHFNSPKKDYTPRGKDTGYRGPRKKFKKKY